MSENAPLHPSIVALVSLAANIASNHPKKGLCQLDRLRGMAIAEHHIATVVEISRHIRDEAGQMLDSQFDEQSQEIPDTGNDISATRSKEGSLPADSCCSTTAGGQSCC